MIASHNSAIERPGRVRSIGWVVLEAVSLWKTAIDVKREPPGMVGDPLRTKETHYGNLDRQAGIEHRNLTLRCVCSNPVELLAGITIVRAVVPAAAPALSEVPAAWASGLRPCAGPFCLSELTDQGVLLSALLSSRTTILQIPSGGTTRRGYERPRNSRERRLFPVRSAHTV